MNKFASLLLLVASVSAQDAINATVLSELASAFTSAGYTTLATAAATIANTTVGSNLLKTITNGNANYTIFTPTNAALAAADKATLNDPDKLAEIIAYHISPGFFLNETEVYTTPNNTILPTFFNATGSVNLQGNASQVISLTNSGGSVKVNNQGSDATTVDKVTIAANRFALAQVAHVLTPPANLSAVLKANSLTMFSQAAQQAGILDLLTHAKGITIFAPTDDAISAALSKLGANATNATIIGTILQNHIINGTTVYSTEFDTKNYTSGAGEALNSWIYNNTWTVYSGSTNNITANVTKRDILAANGVVHVINAVLANTERDDNAASSAYNSATNDANHAQPTGGSNGGGPVGGSPGHDAAAPRFGMALWSATGAAVLVGALLATSL